jgi:hypothetical protein
MNRKGLRFSRDSRDLSPTVSSLKPLEISRYLRNGQGDGLSPLSPGSCDSLADCPSFADPSGGSITPQSKVPFTGDVVFAAARKTLLTTVLDH